jgi:hypothetical protein
MNRLSVFFKGADPELGTSYPAHYLLARFPNLAAADDAKKALNKAGQLDVVCASGDEVIEFAKYHAKQDGLWGAVTKQLSRAIDTGANETDQDLEAAQQGAGFVAVHCPTEESKAETWKVLEPTHPVAARYYAPGGIEHF